MNSIDWSAVVEAGLAFLAFIGAGISVWVTLRINDTVEAAVTDVRVKEINPLKLTVINQHEEILKLQGLCAQQATRDDFHNIAIQIERLAGEVKTVNVSIKNVQDSQAATQKAVQRVDDYLLNEKV